MNETKLYLDLLRATNCLDEKQIDNLLKAVSINLPSIMSAVWLLNDRSNTVSILTRVNYSPKSLNEIEFIHKLEDSLIGYMVKKMHMGDLPYLDIPSIKEEPYWDFHLSKIRVEDLGLKRLISIPVPIFTTNKEKPRFDAIINIYPVGDYNVSSDLIEIIKDQFSLSLSRIRLFRRERLTREIIEVYEKRGKKDLGSILHPIINSILRKFIPYEGCSVFIWDPFLSRLALTQTTGLVGKPKKKDVYYYLGEGLTGNIAKLKKPFTISDLNKIDDEGLKIEYKHKFMEETVNNNKTFMAIPIMSPSRPDDIVGVIRFTNKLNPKANVVDCFSDHDLSLVEHACNLIALYMEYEQSERVRFSFATQLSHEMFTPAFSIRVTADRLLQHINSPTFYQTEAYLIDIFDQSSLQIALIDSISLLWKSSSSKEYIYDLENISIEDDVLIPSKKLVIPAARKESINFDLILIKGFFPKNIFLDRNAFQQVFFNLLTNSIKYRKKSKHDEFGILIEGLGQGKYRLPQEFIEFEKNEGEHTQELIEGFLIKVSDFGIGIREDELFKIFLQGYRTKGIEKEHVRGLGLGLTVVKRVLDDFGCKIWVSNLKNPTSIKILLPIELKRKDHLIKKWKNKN
jgi:signal transduction histidine kinase